MKPTNEQVEQAHDANSEIDRLRKFLSEVVAIMGYHSFTGSPQPENVASMLRDAHKDVAAEVRRLQAENAEHTTLWIAETRLSSERKIELEDAGAEIARLRATAGKRCGVEGALGGGYFRCDNPVSSEGNGHYCAIHGKQDARNLSCEMTTAGKEAATLRAKVAELEADKDAEINRGKEWCTEAIARRKKYEAAEARAERLAVALREVMRPHGIYDQAVASAGGAFAETYMQTGDTIHAALAGQPEATAPYDWKSAAPAPTIPAEESHEEFARQVAEFDASNCPKRAEKGQL